MLLLRLSLVVAILASIGTFVVGHVNVSNKIGELNKNLEDTKSELATTKSSEATAKADAKKAKGEADSANKQLAETRDSLETTRQEAGKQRKRADGLAGDLEKTTKEKNAAQQELTQWAVLGVTPDQVRAIQVELKAAKETIEVANDEKKVLTRNNSTLRAELEKYTVGEEKAPPLPAGLKGKVLAVDPRYDFVVIDLGEKDGIVPRGELLVNRDGKLVAKIRILRVEAGRCIANVLPQWKQADVVEGDQILN